MTSNLLYDLIELESVSLSLDYCDQRLRRFIRLYLRYALDHDVP